MNPKHHHMLGIHAYFDPTWHKIAQAYFDHNPAFGDTSWWSKLPIGGKFARHHFNTDGHIEVDNPIIHDHNSSGIIFMNVYCDMRHVLLGHKDTLGSVMDISKLDWHITEYGSVQHAPLIDHTNEAIPAYRDWYTLTSGILDGRGTQDEDRCIRFGFFYPWLNIEVFPLCTVISVVVPTSPSSCRNIVRFFYPRVLVEQVELFAKYRTLQEASYKATASEDNVFITRISSGLRDLHESGEHFFGLPHPSEESGILAYHEFLEPIEREYWKQKFP